MKAVRAIALGAVVVLVAAACAGGTSETTGTTADPGVEDATDSTTAGATISCAPADDSALGTQVVCTLDAGSAHMVDLTDVMSAANTALNAEDLVTESTNMWIQAWGGDGHYDSSFDGPAAGIGGFAQTMTSVQSYNDAFSTDELWFWASDSPEGGAGGASTIVASFEPETPGSFLTTTNGLVLLAGGGGGGNGPAGGGGRRSAGGNGGFAVSTTGEASGSGGDAQFSDGGRGGNNPVGSAAGGPGGGISGTQGGSGGDEGIGGTGGSAPNNSNRRTGWIGGGPVLDLNFPGGGGSGDEGPDHDGVGGGGGYGGGGGGGGSNFDTSSHVGGGGGGGSWALASLLCDGNAQTINNFNPNGASDGTANRPGLVRIVFDLDPQPCS